MKFARKDISVPIGVCPSCFNEQQRYFFPFLVYCPHNETLAVMRAADEHATFQCAPEQLENVLHRLQSAAEANPSRRPEAGRA